MNRLQLILTFIILITISCHSQDMHKENLVDEKSNSNLIDSVIFDCYNGSQLEMNICSLREFEYYDSILQERYIRLIAILDSHLEIESQYADSFEYLETKEIKDAIISSQKTWFVLRNKNSKIQGLKYKRGSMENMVINLQMTYDTKDRIKSIENLINDEVE